MIWPYLEIAHAKKWLNCIYIAITFEIFVQNRQKLYFSMALVMCFLKIYILFDSLEV